LIGLVHAVPAHAEEARQFRLHFEADSNDLTLQHQKAVIHYGDFGRSLSLWEEVCSAPCDRLVPRGGVFRLAGGGAMPTDPLAIPEDDQIELVARTGSLAKKIGGIALIAGANFFLAGGTAAAVAGFALPSGDARYQPDAGWLAGGGLALAAGITAYFLGFSMVHHSDTTVGIRGSGDATVASQ
jgi:hypothetical protein